MFVAPGTLYVCVSTLALPNLGKITALAVGADGTVFVATDSALCVLTPAGTLAPLAGCRSERGYKDGKGIYTYAHIHTHFYIHAQTHNAHILTHKLTNMYVGPDARFHNLRGLAVVSDGSLLVTDAYNHCLRRVSQVISVSRSPPSFTCFSFCDWGVKEFSLS